MVEAFFGFKKTPFSDSPDAKQLFASQAWNQVKARLQFLVDHHGAGLLTGEVGAGKSTAARTFTAGLNPNLYRILVWAKNSILLKTRGFGGLSQLRGTTLTARCNVRVTSSSGHPFANSRSSCNYQ